jgi:hypothetical protein
MKINNQFENMTQMDPKTTLLTCTNQSGDFQSNHAVTLVGYNIIENTKKSFWVIKNSWGQEWGNNGYFAVSFADYPSYIFSDFSFVDDSTTIQLNQALFEKQVNVQSKFDFGKNPFTTKYNAVLSSTLASKPNYTLGYNPGFARQDTKRFAVSLSEKELGNLDPKFENSMSFTTTNNPFNVVLDGPVYNQGACGCCWIFAGCSMLSSAMAIAYLKQTKKKKYVFLSPQSFLDQIESEIKSDSCAIQSDMGCAFGTYQLPVTQNCPKIPSQDRSLSSICCHGGNNPMFITFVNGESPDKTLSNENSLPLVLQSIQTVPYFIPYSPVVNPPNPNVSVENFISIQETKFVKNELYLYLFLIFYIFVFLSFLPFLF